MEATQGERKGEKGGEILKRGNPSSPLPYLRRGGESTSSYSSVYRGRKKGKKKEEDQEGVESYLSPLILCRRRGRKKEKRERKKIHRGSWPFSPFSTLLLTRRV